MSDPLQKLWELVDSTVVQDKPELDSEIPAFQGTLLVIMNTNTL